MRLLFALLSIFCLSLSASAEEKRIALLIGNNDYPATVGKLSNTHSDIDKIGASLKSTGFEVIARKDQDRTKLLLSVGEFEARISEETKKGNEVVAFFYFSGHGVAVSSGGQAKNFILPATHSITNRSELEAYGVDFTDLVDRFAATKARAFFVISDACRNELGASFSRSVARKGFGVTAQRPDMVIAFSTAAGATAPDDGVFADTLAKRLKIPGEEAEISFLRTLRDVSKTRQMSEQPFMTGALNKPFCFAGCNAGDEDKDWREFAGLNNASAFETYLSIYPNGKYAKEASDRLAKLKKLTPETDKVRPNPKNNQDQSKVCANLDAHSCFSRGYDYQVGRNGVSPDLNKAIAYYRAACEAGSKGSCFNLGNRYAKGDGVALDHNKAAQLYDQACSKGEIKGCGKLGQMVLAGLGLPQNREEGIRLLKQACYAGMTEYCKTLDKHQISR